MLIVRRLLPFLYFWTAAWNLNFFVAKQLLFRPYEKVITWLFSKSVSVFLKLSIYPSLEGKSYFSQKDTGRILIFCVFYLPLSQQVVVCQFWKFHLLWLFTIKVTSCAPVNLHPTARPNGFEYKVVTQAKEYQILNIHTSGVPNNHKWKSPHSGNFFQQILVVPSRDRTRDSWIRSLPLYQLIYRFMYLIFWLGNLSAQ